MNIINPAAHVQSFQATYHNFPMRSALIVWTNYNRISTKEHNTNYLLIKDKVTVPVYYANVFSTSERGQPLYKGQSG